MLLEIHNTYTVTEDEVGTFKQCLKAAGCEPIIIDYPNGSKPLEFMMAYKMKIDCWDSFPMVLEKSNQLAREIPFECVRQKIEWEPKHGGAAPVFLGEGEYISPWGMVGKCRQVPYFEIHTHIDTEQGWPTSINRCGSGRTIHTFQSCDEKQVCLLAKRLGACTFEWVLYDTKPSHECLCKK